SNAGAALDGAWASPSGHIWAVGDGIRRFDGSQWTTSSSPVTAHLRAVAGSAADNIWAVGDYPAATGHPGPAIVHWDGTQWTLVPLVRFDRARRAVWVNAANDVWITGEGGYVLHFDGSQVVDEPRFATVRFNGIWANSAGDVVAVGDGGQVWRRDPVSHAWTQ